jgi:asparagine synthase (glutamine-hydrolysing)
MLARVRHRGPDGFGFAEVGDAWLGHTRLAIVDVDGGAQPLHAGHAAMVGNGEIYNHRELRESLPAGMCQTDSDNEVALHLVRTWGPESLSDLWGMYAVAVATEEHGLVVARDPLGIKPLYWRRSDDDVAFASELKAFPEHWQPDVRTFPPGHWWSARHGLQSMARGWRPDGHTDHAASDEPAADDLALVRDTLISAVKRWSMADVPIGVFLSGGLDSTLIGAIAARHAHDHGRVLHSFSIGVPGSSDLKAAEEAAEFLGTEHHVCEVQPEDLLDRLPHTIRSIESFDPMLVHSAVMNDLLAEFAAAFVKVVLTGEGADELFAGYEYHRGFDDPHELHGALVDGVAGLHNLNLQRCDRVTMAHGLEARVPFLDLDVVRTVLSMPASWKQTTGGRPEKWLLRTAFEGWLPDWLLWRRKEQFGDGTGASDVLTEYAAAQIDAREFERLRAASPTELRTPEEAYYYELFAEQFGDVDVDDVVGRFAAA